ncbi:YheC/YheD family protein [Staphylococcus caeli]|uniref:Endospore coat-associated protein yheD n=1 Tax=Staphylococcus caeli TaxID=2201815 RepID=A0A1D4L9J7_9STAP|nr:YheC/YheD family protein [Staphylococcus caeli]SCS82840.1 Endospore coat-associated protein yheD [Staphylococcus caeli]SCT01355.1 Endospore coat-associated protein yheD [Staphylococcus caeli]
MKTVGMLRSINKPGLVAKSVAYVCAHQHIPFYYFTPNDVNLDNTTINAKFLENGQWIHKTIPFPTVIDNEPINKTNKALYNVLKEHATFTTYPLGGKTKVFNLLYENEEKFKDVLIPFKIVENQYDVIDFIDKYQKILLKPSISNQGRDIVAIEKLKNGYHFINDTSIDLISKVNFEAKLNELILSKKYICQPFIHSKTKSGIPFDFRLHVRKKANGKWTKVKAYPRIGIEKNITANISQGGAIASIVPFLKTQYPNDWRKIKNKIDIICTNFPRNFEKLYPYPLDALGIDLGIDTEGKLWLFEVNTYPGQKFFEIESAEKRVDFYKYLLSQTTSNN